MSTIDLRTDTTINGQPILHQGNHGNVKWAHKYLVPLNSPYITQPIVNGGTPYLRVFSFSTPITTNRTVHELGFRVTNVLSYDWGSTGAFDFFLQILYTSSNTVSCNLYVKDLTNVSIANINHYVIVTKDASNYTFDVYFNIRENSTQFHIYPLFTNNDKMLSGFLTDEQGTSSSSFSTIQSSAFMSVQSIHDIWMTGIDEAFRNPTFQNGWTNFGSGYANIQYKKIGNVVHLRGVGKSGTVANGTTGIMFTLPSGYRPLSTLSFAVNSNGLFGRMDIDSSGNVYAISGSNAFFSVQCSFIAEQ